MSCGHSTSGTPSTMSCGSRLRVLSLETPRSDTTSQNRSSDTNGVGVSLGDNPGVLVRFSVPYSCGKARRPRHAKALGRDAGGSPLGRRCRELARIACSTIVNQVRPCRWGLRIRSGAQGQAMSSRVSPSSIVYWLRTARRRRPCGAPPRSRPGRARGGSQGRCRPDRRHRDC